MKNIQKKTRQIHELKGPSKSLSFLYHTPLGRTCLKLLVRPSISKISGRFLNTKLSSYMIKSFIKKNNIDLSEYEQRKFRSYNDFFTRKVLEGKRNVVMDQNVLISPCDAKLSAYTISETSTFKIKDSYYTVSDLLGSNEIYKDYENGLCLIFRLAVDDYHRYCYIDNGSKSKNIFVPGELHTVQPIALEKYNIYKRNAREYTVLHTENFGDVVQIEVGALMVGKIVNFHEEYSFNKGEEKGLFEFGGSTIVLLIKENTVSLDKEFFANTKRGLETIVKYGERIGVKYENTIKKNRL